MPSGPEIHKMLVISTAHVSFETADMIDKSKTSVARWQKPWAPTFTRDEGWVFYVGLDSYEGAPSDLREAVEYAKSIDCQWLMFDRDAEQIDNLKTYDW